MALTFAPSSQDINWDGASKSLVSVIPSCTSTSATYSVSIQHVEPSSVQKVVFISGSTVNVDVHAGSAYLTNDSPNYVAASAFSVSCSVSTAGEVSFYLDPAASGYTATIDYDLTLPAYYTWKMTETKSGLSRPIVMGKLTRTPLNPYSAIGKISGDRVSSVSVGESCG